MNFGMSDLGENPNSKWKFDGSGFLNQKRSDPDPYSHNILHASKAARPDPFSKAMSMRSDCVLSVPATTNNMLSFSSSFSTNNGNQTSPFSFHHIGNAGCDSGGLQSGTHVPVSTYKGPFTPSQWMELKHQALIYKYMVANVPIPSHLLIAIRKSLDPFRLSASNAPSSYGWGGLSGKIDPEPGRCRRTDGKKWRCSKDAVIDHKYCEKHMNRGRHRSRKLVEDKNGGNNQFKNLHIQKASIEDKKPSNYWQNSGGPLGEALKTSSMNAWSHMSEYSGFSYSPTGVLQKATFVSLSNGSSPRGGDECSSTVPFCNSM